MLRRTAGRAAASAVVLAALVAGAVVSPAAGAASPAAAATPPRLLISDDGDVWERHLSGALFGDGPSLVPGTSSTASFWVKNLSRGPAVLRTSVSDVRASSAALAEHLSVTTAAPADVAGTTTVALGDGSCSGSVPASVLAAGQEVELDVDVALDERATTAAADQSVDFTVLVTLTGTTPRGALPAGCCVPTGGDAVRVAGTSGGARTPDADVLVPARGELRTAGDGPARRFGDVPGPSFVPVPLRETWLPVAAALVAAIAGAALALVRRRRRDEDGA